MPSVWAMAKSHRIRDSAARIDESNISVLAFGRPLTNAEIDASLDRLARDEAFNVSPELRHVFGAGRSRITIHRPINDRLRQVGIEVPRGTLATKIVGSPSGP